MSWGTDGTLIKIPPSKYCMRAYISYFVIFMTAEFRNLILFTTDLWDHLSVSLFSLNLKLVKNYHITSVVFGVWIDSQCWLHLQKLEACKMQILSVFRWDEVYSLKFVVQSKRHK